MPDLDLNNLKVELVRHIAKQQTELGLVDVTFNQCFVQCNDKRVGIYCGLANQPGKHLSFTEQLPVAVQQAIAEKVAKATGGVSHFTSPPPEEHEVIEHDDE